MFAWANDWLTDTIKEVLGLVAILVVLAVALFYLLKFVYPLAVKLLWGIRRLLAKIQWKILLKLGSMRAAFNKKWNKTIFAKRAAKRRHRRRVLMSKKYKRYLALNLLYGDKITDFLEDLFFQNIINKKELKAAYNRFGIGAKLPHLISPMSVFLRNNPKDKGMYPKPDQLKGEINSRLHSGIYDRPFKVPDSGIPDSPIQKVFARK